MIITKASKKRSAAIGMKDSFQTGNAVKWDNSCLAAFSTANYLELGVPENSEQLQRKLISVNPCPFG